MRTDLDLVAAADRNFLGSFRKLIEHIPDGAVADFGGVFAFRTGLPIGLFNGCVVDHPASSAAVVEALDWIGDGLPHLLWIHDELADPLGSIGRDRGMERESWQTPQMILGPPPTMPEPAPGVVVPPEPPLLPSPVSGWPSPPPVRLPVHAGNANSAARPS